MTTSPQPTATLHALTGLRFIAAVHVVLYHYGTRTFEGLPAWIVNILHAGYVGVTLFFVLSGFILTYVYLDADARRTVDARKFWIARVARIYPVYLLGLLLWLPFFLGKAGGNFISPLTAWITGVTAPVALQAWIPSAACVWNCPSWSVSVEGFFYLLFPLLVAVLYPRLRVSTPVSFALTFVGLWALSLLPPTIYLLAERTGAFHGQYEVWLAALKFNPLTRLPEFLMGITLGKFYLTRRAQGHTDIRAGTLLGPIVALLIVVIIAVSPRFPYVYLHNGMLAPLFAALIYALATNRGALTAALSVPLLVLLGEASYSLYVFHAPLWDWLYKFASGAGLQTNEGTSLPFLAAYLAIIVGVSVLAFRFIEIPARDALRNLLSGKPIRSAPKPRDASVPAVRFNPRRPEFLAGILVGLVAAGGFLLHPLFARAEKVRSSLPVAAPTTDEVGATGSLLDPARLAQGVEAAGWRPVGGQWTVSDGSVVQKQTQGYDLNLVSSGVYDAPYVFRVAFRLLSGNGGGVIFNAPNADSKNGAQLVRYTDDGSGIFWGRFDASGKFTGDGFAQTLPPEKAGRHVLELRVAESTYGIVLDGRELVANAPLRSPSGHIGLQTSVSSVAFDSAEVVKEGISKAQSVATPDASGKKAPARPDTSASTETPGTSTADTFRETFAAAPDKAGWSVLGGTWALKDGAFVETTEKGFDQVLRLDKVFTAPFTFSTTFRNLTGNGGGVVFGASDSTDRSGRHQVRFSDDGTALFWGYFDANGDFVGQGSAKTQAPGTAPHILRVDTTPKTYSLALDGTNVARDVPLRTPSGRVGLQSSAGTARFEAVEVTPGKATASSP
ncbi:acyltransferase family protein [Deinococcus yavapaiensis]|uniref:Peptidoglycan/LPS O-acetylase OafA/YrhL n=1 Tax=Deinococcus yavapaiensis KR-236 TaxID=694435 RepID=A0A318S6A0_9DEIO|nr:acyltransferase family protein [Deinococcus yavapaiensis]PYE49910.1 peptidoglycan/LPS O-acetylase OafA/YrhL [Deinococcus yavapaiensis KR-236]